MSPEALTGFTWENASPAPFLLPLRLHPHLAARGLKLGRHANTGYPGQTIAKKNQWHASSLPRCNRMPLKQILERPPRSIGGQLNAFAIAAAAHRGRLCLEMPQGNSLAEGRAGDQSSQVPGRWQLLLTIPGRPPVRGHLRAAGQQLDLPSMKSWGSSLVT
jgi:hypothetical protein